ncbi:hypothetical protein CDD80_7498 [Ophiocordyceps camponoti-rufipedis]|uniref:Uncharacterized protein n=1 Tax=Ophiocordyceps camponoti-rufipedis TaxID=2004952 RepID=A0A2C5YMC5_9HYPO|nr:hypothetical protein CDD80_7498 [Ophiocordyceps camponoti-rufipedis]
MSPSTILITGANGSLALAAVSHLLKHSPSQTLLLTVRNASADDVNTQALRRLVAHRQEGVYIRELDLSRLEHVRDFADEVEAHVAEGRLPPLASIVCNAYYWNLVGPAEMTVDGFEKSMQVSHLSHAALVMRLVRSCAPKARILLFSSAVHRPGRGAPFEKLPPSIPSPLELLVRPGPDADDDRAAHGFQRYANAKLVITAWGFALLRRLQKDPSLRHISVVIVNPGVLSDSRALLVNTPRKICLTSRLLIRPLQPLLRLLMDRTIRTSAEAAVEMARLATNEAVPGQSGFFTMLERDESSEESRDQGVQEALWEASARWLGMSGAGSHPNNHLNCNSPHAQHQDKATDTKPSPFPMQGTPISNLTEQLASLLPPPTIVDDSNKAYGVAVTCALLSGLTTSVVAWRLYLRYASRAFGLDDWATVPALVLYIAWSIMAVYVNLAGGIGKPLWQITLGEYAIWFKGFLASSWMYTSMTAAIRIAILLFYRRIFAQSISWLRRVIHLLLALQAVYVVVYSVLPALACRPFDSAWNPFERRAHCNDWFFYYSQVALYSTSMVFDLFLLVLPLEPCSRLQMRRSRKAGVIAMFALGAGASIVTAVKLAIFVNDMNGYSEFDPYCKSHQLPQIISKLIKTSQSPATSSSTSSPPKSLIGASLPGLRPALNVASTSVSQTLRSLYHSRGSDNRTARGQTWTGHELGSKSASFSTASDRRRERGLTITRVIETKVSCETVHGSQVQLGQYPAPHPSE